MRPYVLVLLAVITACGGDDGGLTTPTTGALEIRTATSGHVPSGDYTYSVDTEPAQAIGTTATIIRPDLEAGSHVVQLGGLPDGCTVISDNPQTASITAGSTTIVAFAINCIPPVGTIQVITATSGPAPATYDLVMDGTSLGAIGSSTTRSLESIPSGVHSIGLSALAANCQLQGENPQSTSVQSGGTVTVSFTITCTVPPAETGTLSVTTATTGSEPDADGYVFSVDGQAAQPIGATATVTLANVATGSHRVALSGMAENCAVNGANPRMVTVTTGATADASFAIHCAPATVGQWSRMESGTTFSLYSVWGSSPTDVFTVGEPGGRFESGIFHYDGQAWSKQSTQEGVTLYTVWGTGSNDVFAVGSSPLGEHGYDGVLLHYDGSTWAAMQGPGVGTEDGIVAVNFYSVWGTSGTNVFAVGESNTGFSRAIIARYDGVRWSDMDLPVRDDRILRDVFGTSPQDVYAVGYFDVSVSLRRGASSVAPSRLLVEGVVLHYDGTRWSEIQSAGGSVALNGVWASASTDVFAVGSSNDHAIIYHFDGTSWATMTVPPTGPLLDVWGTSSTDVYAVGAGTILHYDGQSWIEVRADVERLAGVWASSASDVFAVGSGGTILRGTPGTAGSANP